MKWYRKYLEYNIMEEFKNYRADSSDEVYSEAVRAGKRTYFFDVKSTKNDDYYITLTESRRKVERDGSFSYEKHKIFLYKEDFEKFGDAFNKAVGFVKENKKDFFENGASFGISIPKEDILMPDAPDNIILSDIDREFESL